MNFNLNLYLITSSLYLTSNTCLEEAVKETIEGGTTIVQLREKNMCSKDLYKLAIKVKKVTDSYNIPLIINDRIDITLAVNANGVHLGQDDLPISIARKILGDKKIIGISTHNLKEAKEAQKSGADYIGYGSIFDTKTKQNVIKNNLKGLKEITEKVNIPVVAIGGITSLNILKVLNMNVDGVCICNEIMSSMNIKKTTNNLIWKIQNGGYYEI